ncbi:sporulation-control protein [Peribacillus deserti]|uniref:Sporulation-control protein n=1 Tax=Peribacillus deserti TaxID=673318 RepID=A0ABS2QH85_9BACI|nr:sporulation protein [Peribacillus deserti]MBM7692521.1 sporulation-control protein [Peribacillus deserti]
MALFNKMLASIGIGTAKVDTRLDSDRYLPGQTVQGKVEIRGGSVEQKIEEIYLTLHTTYIKEQDDKKYTQTAALEKLRLNDPFTIAPGELRTMPFSLVLPNDTPLTYGRTKVWISTGLEIKNAVDPSDEDFIQILPGPIVHAALLALTDLGFKLRQAECEAVSYKLNHHRPFIQEFEFIPVTGPYHGKLDELEISFLSVSEERAEILLEVDRKAKGLAGLFAEAMEMDETMVRAFITKQDIPQMREKLNQIISRYI